MLRKHFRIAAASAAIAIAASACGTEAGDTTSLSVLLKDAPGDFHSAVVTITGVSLVGSGGETVLSSTPVTTDLLTLAATTAELVTDVTVPSGSYGQLRIRISGAYIEVENEDGSTSIYATPGYAEVPAGVVVAGELQMPSFAQSGLKVTMAEGALELEGDEKILLLDFDVEQSFGQAAGGSSQWVMHPVITGAELGLTGGVDVTVANADGVSFDIGAATASLTDAGGAAVGAAQALTDVDGDGTFEARFGFLAPGTYHVTVTPAAGATIVTDPASPLGVTVVSGARATAAFTVTSAN